MSLVETVFAPAPTVIFTMQSMGEILEDLSL